MSELDVLIKARELISRPENWTRGCPARNKAGKDVPVKSDKAFSFCLLGAIARPDSNPIVRTNVINVLQRNHYSLIDFNDSHNHTEVLALLDDTIHSLKEGN